MNLESQRRDLLSDNHQGPRKICSENSIVEDVNAADVAYRKVENSSKKGIPVNIGYTCSDHDPITHQHQHKEMYSIPTKTKHNKIDAQNGGQGVPDLRAGFTRM